MHLPTKLPDSSSQSHDPQNQSSPARERSHGNSVPLAKNSRRVNVGRYPGDVFKF